MLHIFCMQIQSAFLVISLFGLLWTNSRNKKGGRCAEIEKAGLLLLRLSICLSGGYVTTEVDNNVGESSRRHIFCQAKSFLFYTRRPRCLFCAVTGLLVQ